MDIILNKIYCGITASEDEFPWVVSVHNKKDKNLIGGGCIIHQYFVLTAAHLFFDERGQRKDNPEEYFIVVGSTERCGKKDNIYDLKNVIFHNDFNYKTTKNDICILQLFEEINSIQPIQFRNTPVLENEEVFLPGWGIRRKCSIKYRPKHLTYLKLKYKSFKQGLFLRDIYFPKTKLPIDKNNICTFTNNGQTVEHGDSGSPLVYNNELIGICSWGDDSYTNSLTVFVNVEEYKPWIKKVINEYLLKDISKFTYFQNKINELYETMFEV